MAHIDISREHQLGIDGARRAAEQVVLELKHEHGLPLATRWEGDVLHASGRGFDAWLDAHRHHVRVRARLGLFLRPLRSTIAREVHEYLDRFLGDRDAA